MPTRASTDARPDPRLHGAQRRTVIEAAVLSMLLGYRVPGGFTEEQSAAFVDKAVAALDRRLPPGTRAATEQALAQVAEAVAERHDAHDWPVLPVLVAAADAVLSVGAVGTRPETYAPDDSVKLFARRMAAGEAVPEDFLMGRGLRSAVAAGLVAAEVADRWREGVRVRWRQTYRDQADAMLVARYGEGALR